MNLIYKHKIKLHFVHWNNKKYKNATEAQNSNSHDGLLVLGIFVQVGRFNYSDYVSTLILEYTITIDLKRFQRTKTTKSKK